MCFKRKMTEKYVSRKIAMNALGVSPMTLLKMEENNKIEVLETMGGHRKYNIEKYIADNKQPVANDNIIDQDDADQIKVNICYVRVSTAAQKGDLQRQKAYMKKKYSAYEIVEDIGSGINFNRKGFRKIIKLAIEGKIDTLVVAYRDRLTRFGYDFIDDLVQEYSNGKIIVENDKDEKKAPKEELVDDVMQILNVYTAKMNGL